MPKSKKIRSSKFNSWAATRLSEERTKKPCPLKEKELQSEIGISLDFSNDLKECEAPPSNVRSRSRSQQIFGHNQLLLRGSTHLNNAKKISKSRYFNFICSLPIVELYKNAWATEPAYMEHICGINFEKLYCKLTSLKLFHFCDISDAECSSTFQSFVCQCLVPKGMPFAVDTSNKLGAIVLTPFYSVIPAFLIKVPSVMISLQNMNLSHVVNNLQFRHELAFNKDLKIEVPREILDFSKAQGIWSVFAIEIKSVFESPQARPPSAAIFQVIYWIRDLMLSVLPATVGPEIIINVDPVKFINNISCSEARAVCTATNFICAMLDTCIIPLRRGWLSDIRASFKLWASDPGHLVRGLKNTVTVLNLTKVDQLNFRIRKNATKLWETTGIIEKHFYHEKITSGKLSAEDFTNWIRDQPTLEELSLVDRTCYISSYAQVCTRSTNRYSSSFNRLIAGFIASFFRFSSRNSVPEIFQLDRRRILCLQVKLDSVILEYLNQALEKYIPGQQQSISDLMRSPNLQSRKVYQVVESRIFTSVAQRIYKSLVTLFDPSAIKTSNFTKQDTNLRHMCISQMLSIPVNFDRYLECQLDEVIQEMTRILVLHWTGTRQYYEEMS